MKSGLLGLPSRWRTMCLLASLLAVLPAGAQSTSLLRIESLQVQRGQPLLFTFSDQGTGATNYQLEFSEVVGPAPSWEAVTSAVVTDLGGGLFQVVAPDPQTDQGYYRVRGLGGTATVTASFSATAFQVTEGGMVAPVITFNAPYAGLVRYTISGTVKSGDYLNLSGEVMVNGTSATIPVTFTDNDMIGQLKYLALTLEAGPGYRIGAGGTTTITVDENDADWQGTFHTRGANLGFLLAIAQFNGAPMATLRSDELGLFPTNETSVAVTFHSDEFQVDTAAIPLEAQATPFGAPAQLLFHLEASNAATNQTVSSTSVEGDGYLVSQYPGQPQLTTTNFGTFTLFKRALAPSTNQVDLVEVY